MCDILASLAYARKSFNHRLKGCMTMLRHCFCILPFIAACATGTASIPNIPGNVPYIVHQISFHHGSAVACGPDVGPPSVADINDAIEATVAAFAEAKAMPLADVQAYLEKYKPAAYVVDAIDCAKAHDKGCGGFIASDNTLHIRGVHDGCLAKTSFVHFFLHYLLGCQSGAMDIDHTDPIFKDTEASVNLRLAQKCASGAGTLKVTGTLVN
jgi:hypothetical protein